MDTQKLKDRILKKRKYMIDRNNKILADGRRKMGLKRLRDATWLWRKITTDRKAKCFMKGSFVYAVIDNIEFLFNIESFMVKSADGIPANKYSDGILSGFGSNVSSTSDLGDILLFVDKQREINKRKGD